MKYVYFLLMMVFVSTTTFGQTGKPIHAPIKATTTTKTLKPIQTITPIGIPNARTSVVKSFHPATLSSFTGTPINKRLRIVERSKKGTPIMIKGILDNASGGRTIDLQVFDYLQAIKTPILIKNPTEEFKVIDQKTDNLGQTHFKLQQTFKGVKVYGGQVWLHAQNGKVNLFNGRNYPTPKLDNLTPGISKTDAKSIARQDVSLKTKVKELSEMEQKLIGEQTAPELLIYHPIENDEARLAWQYKFHPNVSNEWEYFIDAHSGEIIDAYKTLCQLHYHTEFEATHEDCEENINDNFNSNVNVNSNSWVNTPQNGPATSIATDLNGLTQTLNSYEIDNNFFLIDASRPMYNNSRSRLPNDPVGAIWTINAQNTYPENRDFNAIHVTTNNNNWNDPISVSAHSNAGYAYEYFRSTFGRNSINGSGGTVLSVINVSDEDGSGLDNAFWTGTAMFYGNGKTAFEPLAKSLDVAGHEIAHGVVQNTANLRYQGESGAMNESFADVFGVLIDRDDYQLGEDVVNTNIFRSGALRDMADPHNGGARLGDPGYQPESVSEQFFGSQDNGGVHINSGITNRAFFLVANTIGKDKAEKIYYRALTTYLVNTSQFVDLRASLLQAATDIHGGDSQEVSVIAQAFDIVGILGNDTGSGSSSGGEVPVEIDANTGDDYILFISSDETSLYAVSTNGQVDLLFDQGIRSRPSVSDDGTIIVFVGGDAKIHYIQIDWSSETFTTEILQDDPVWRNVAISRDGRLVAALELEEKNSIDVFDLNSSNHKQFNLYNPTFTEGIVTNEVQYADIIEFDFTGEYLIYDAINVINTNAGADNIAYWDIGFIKIFDNTINDFEADDRNNIEKLYNGLPEDISIGNPTFSKNSSDIIAFDYKDGTTNEFAIFGLNLTTNDLDLIHQPDFWGYPNYARLDDRIIFDETDEAGNDVIKTIALNENKISGVGEEQTIISVETGAILGVWFSNQVRQLTSTNELEKTILDLQIAPNPFADNLTVQFNLEKSKELLLEVYNTLGQIQISQKIDAQIGLNSRLIDTQNLSEGTYFVSLKSEEGIITRKVVK